MSLGVTAKTLVPELPQIEVSGAIVPLCCSLHVPDGELHVILKVASATPAAATASDWGLSPCTAQLAATPSSLTVWAPTARFATVTLAFGPIGAAGPLSMLYE